MSTDTSTTSAAGPASPEKYRELHAVVDQHCPVLDLFANPTPVHTDLITS